MNNGIFIWPFGSNGPFCSILVKVFLVSDVAGALRLLPHLAVRTSGYRQPNVVQRGRGLVRPDAWSDAAANLQADSSLLQLAWSGKTSFSLVKGRGAQWSEVEFILQFRIIDQRKLCRINPYLSKQLF